MLAVDKNSASKMHYFLTILMRLINTVNIIQQLKAMPITEPPTKRDTYDQISTTSSRRRIFYRATIYGKRGELLWNNEISKYQEDHPRVAMWPRCTVSHTTNPSNIPQ